MTARPSGAGALILAAGVGRRLAASHAGPKALLPFGGRSLMARHIAALRDAGVASITVVTGYEEEALRAHVAACDRDVGVVSNPAFREGSILSLLAGEAAVAGAAALVLMDADVIYERAVLARLLDDGHPDLFLVDRDIEPGDEPVKLCVRDNRIVDFAKLPQAAHDWHGESVGFFRLAAPTAAELFARARAIVAAGNRNAEYEAALREMVVAGPPDRFAFADITGCAWCEIDFPADVERARALLGRIDGDHP